MNKLEKILAQSVTPEMVAEQLTEQEIEEVIEEYELKIESSKEFFDTAEQRSAEYEQKAILCQRFASDWRKTANEEKEKIKTWRSVVEKAKQALKRDAKFAVGDTVVFTKSEKGLFSIGDIGVVKKSLKAYGRYTYHIETPSCAFVVAEEHEIELQLSPNKRRAELIDEAKRFAKNYEEDLGIKVHKEERIICIESADFVTHYRYPQHLVWNEHIAVAYSIAKTLHDFFGYEEMKEASIRFGEDASQPDEIVEGMDVELLDKDGHFLLSGRVAEFNKTSDTIKLSEIYESMDSGIIKELPVHRVTKHGYHISGDTKAKYGDGDE